MADFLTTASTMMCPHGGTVSASTSNTKAQADGAYILRSSDTFSISGCSFTTGSNPSPCAQVVWQTQSLKSSVSDRVLTKDSVGMCIGPSGTQGTVQIAHTQIKGGGV